jgi:hypothetical protein
MNTNRVVAIAVAGFGFVAAIAPVAANLDWTSTAGIIAGVGTVAAVAVKWLDGWQKHEQRIYQRPPSHAEGVEETWGPGS